MSGFQQYIFEQKLRTLRFDLESIQLKEFCEVHNSDGSFKSSLFFHKRSEMKGIIVKSI